MKRLYFYLNVTFYIVTLFPQFLYAQLSETILTDRKSAVVLVKADLPGGVRETGSGIVVGYENSSIYIITATHIVEQQDERATKVYVEFYNKPTSIREAKVLKTDADHDLALLHADGADVINSIRPLPIVDLSKPLIETSRVYTVGHPGKRIWSVNTGAVVNDPDPTKIGFSIDAIEPGNSGGPLFNAEGELIGMVLEGCSYGGYAFRADLAKALVARVWNTPTNNLTTDEPVEFIILKPDQKQIEIGESDSLTLTLLDRNKNVLYNREVSWASTDKSVAAVSLSGILIGQKSGRVTISATCEGKTGSAIVTVTKPVVSFIELNPDTINLEKGEKYPLRAVLKDSRHEVINEERKIEWLSWNKSIAEVSKIGEVEARDSGEATIVAKCERVTGIAKIIVRPALVASIEIIKPNTYFRTATGHIYNLKEKIFLESAHELKARLFDKRRKQIKDQRELNWSSNNTSIISVSTSGEIKCNQRGIAHITAECEGITATIELTVIGGPIVVECWVDPYRIVTKNGRSKEPSKITVKALSPVGKPIPDAYIEIEDNKLLFADSRTNKATGYTNSEGFFVAAFHIVEMIYNNPYNIIVKVSKPGYDSDFNFAYLYAAEETP